MCPPGLHITLGIFFRLWSLLEEDCHLLDIELAKRTAPESVDRAAFVDYSTAIKKQSQLKEQRLELEKYIATLNCGIAQIALQVATPEVQPIITALQQEASSSTNKLQDVVGIHVHFVVIQNASNNI